MLQLSQVLKCHEGYVVFAGSIEESEQLLKYKHLYEKQLHIVNMDIGSDRRYG